MRPRLYHSVAMLLPDCRVAVAGSDVTWDTTAEIFTPPYLSWGPRPVIAQAPADIQPGATLTVLYLSADPVDRAILIRTSSVTHSMPFGECAHGCQTGCLLAFFLPASPGCAHHVATLPACQCGPLVWSSTN